jgi:farnesyl-diphosphate farnesyltransferase
MLIPIDKVIEKTAELMAMLQVSMGYCSVNVYEKNLDTLASELSDTEFCYAALDKVSRSFAVVIRQLPDELRMPVCLFYLSLRGLDTIEDDMQLPLDRKLELLKNFYLECGNEHLSLQHIGDTEDYRHLLRHYYKVSSAFNRLHPKYQTVILHVCRAMGAGMAYFSERKIVTSADFDLYCHYVAGLVGYGLSGLFSASGYEDERLKNQLRISNAMGLLLQKTNITRDYHEDMQQGRIFWPEALWKQYTDDFGWFTANAAHPDALNCLMEMINDALRHVPDCLQYLRLLQNKKIFRFCAIPQVMAVATLAEIYANPDVFLKNVKIHKGTAARIIVETNNMQAVNRFFEKSLRQIKSKTTINLPAAAETKKLLDIISNELKHPSPYQWETQTTWSDKTVYI